MIAGIGTDLVEIRRFKTWHLKSKNALQRVFSDQEIIYCLEEFSKSAERFAVRFALKEAAFKAATQVLGHPPCPFLTWCQACELTRYNGDLKILFDFGHSIQIHCSVSHSQDYAIVFVIIEYLDCSIGIDKPVK